MSTIYTPFTDNDVLAYANSDIPSGNTVTAASDTTFSSQFTVPAGGINANSVIDVHAAGVYSAILTALSLTLNLKVAGTTIASMVLPISVAASNKGWSLDTSSIIQNLVGNTGTFDTQGTATFDTNSMTIVNTTPYTVDTSVPMPVTMTAKFGALASGATVQLRQLMIEVRNFN